MMLKGRGRGREGVEHGAADDFPIRLQCPSDDTAFSLCPTASATLLAVEGDAHPLRLRISARGLPTPLFLSSEPPPPLHLPDVFLMPPTLAACKLSDPLLASCFLRHPPPVPPSANVSPPRPQPAPSCLIHSPSSSTISPPPPSSLLPPVAHLQLCLLEQGNDFDPEAPVILLVHGFGAFGEHWRGNIQELAAAGYRVFAPTYPGVQSVHVGRART